MAGGLAEPALSDFLDSFLAQPLEFWPQHSGEQAEAKYFQRQFQPSTAQDNSHDLHLHTDSASLAESQHCLQAQTFTDVLATVAEDWQPPEINEWGGSFFSAGKWTFEPSQPSGAPETTLARLTSNTADCSSNNSGDAAPLRQEDLTSPVEERPGSEGDSDLEALIPGKFSSSVKLRETASGRAEERRTRKREKDRIEEIQAAIQKAAEDKEQLAAHNADLAKQLHEKDEELRKLRAAESSLPAADDDRLAASFKGDLRLTVQEGREILLTPDQIKQLSEADVAGLWAKYVYCLKDLLRAGGSSPSPSQPALHRIHVLQREAMMLHIRFAIANLPAIKSLNSGRRLDRQLGGGPPEHFWPEVLESLRLSPSQRGLLMEVWGSFAGRVARLSEVRASIHAHLAATIPDGVFGRSFAINFLKAHELMDALKYNLRQEHIVLCDLAANFHKILTPLQNASCLVNSWPYWPNIPQITFLTARAFSGGC